jgi:pimeloyl-ACP methyl ester carboxylesterase
VVFVELALSALLAAAASLGAVGLKIDPVGYRRIIFEPIRQLSLFLKDLDALRHWKRIRATRIPEPETFRVPQAGMGAVEIVAALYRPVGAPRGTVVIQHGSYSWGRKAALIRLLAARLSEDGWLVVAPDSRGFGDSGAPPDVEDPQAWRTASDLSRVIDHIESIAGIWSNDIFVLGHSMGANQTLEGGLADDRVKALILVGPGRYPDREDLLMPLWERARFSADRRLGACISRGTALFFFSLGNIRLLAESELATPNHKPILLIDGEKEGAAKLAYMRDIVRKLKGPVEYHTLRATGHYCGARSFYGSERIYYRPDLFEPFYGLVADFLTRKASVSEEEDPEAAFEPELRMQWSGSWKRR